MFLGHSGEREAFHRDVTAISKELSAELLLTNVEIGKHWEELEEGRQQHHDYLAKVGIKPKGRSEGVLRLNIGGSNANVHLSLVGRAAGYRVSVLGSLFEAGWDQRIPRDHQVREFRWVLPPDSSIECV